MEVLTCKSLLKVRGTVLEQNLTIQALPDFQTILMPSPILF